MRNLMEEVEPLAAGMRTLVLDDLGRRVSSVVGPSWEGLREEIQRLDRALQQAEAWRAEDLEGAFFLKISCALLAIHRTLSPHFEKPRELLDRIREVIDAVHFAQGMEAFLEERIGIPPGATPEQAWEGLCSNFIPRGQAQYGRGWVVEEGIRDEKRFFCNFTRCGFADFFLAHNAREVLYLLCASDYRWTDALGRYGIRFERPTTLSEGADACRFQFFRT